MNKFIFTVLTFFVVSCHQNSKKTMFIQSSGVVQVFPDRASLSVKLSCLKKTPKAARDCLIKQAQQLNEQFLNLGIQQEDILTTQMNMDKSYKWIKGEKIFQGYIIYIKTSVVIKNLDNLGTIYTQLFENESLQVSDLSYSYSKMDSLKNEAYIKALKKSEHLADELLKNLPQTKKEILSISNTKINSFFAKYSGDKPYYGPREIMEDMPMQSRTIPINKGKIFVKANLLVSFGVE